MKRYLAFAYDNFYPSGGRDDFVGDFDTVEAAIYGARHTGRDFFDVLDTTTGEWCNERNEAL